MQIKSDLFTLSSDLISSTISNILNSQLNKMDEGEISALRNNLMISDLIKTYVQFENRYKSYLDDIYLKDYLNDYYIYNNNYDQLSPYTKEPLNKDYINELILELNNKNTDYSISNVFENDNKKYIYLATKNRELKAGVFTGDSLGYIVFEIKLDSIDTPLNIINKDDFLNIKYLPIESKKINSFNVNSTLNNYYLSSPIDFMNSKIYIYKKYNNYWYYATIVILSALYILMILLFSFMKTNYDKLLINKIPILNNFQKKQIEEKNVFDNLNNILTQKEFEIEFLKNYKNNDNFSLFISLYKKYNKYMDLPNYIAFFELKDMNFIYKDKIDFENFHPNIVEKININSECLREFKNNFFENNLSNLEKYINNFSELDLSKIKNLYLDFITIKDKKLIILIKHNSKKQLFNFKQIIRNL